MRDMYEGDEYGANNPSWHEADSPWKASKIATMMRRHGLGQGRICEIGCGTGEILINLADEFPEAQFGGYEIAPQAYQRAVEKQSPRVSFHLADLLSEDITPYDLMLTIDVIEHVDDLYGFLTKLRTKAKYKIFHIPLDMSAQSVARSTPIMGLREGVGHIHYFYKDSALATLRDTGYRVIDHFYTASRLELPDQARSSKIMALPRRAAFKANPDLAVRVLGGYSLLVLAE